MKNIRMKFVRELALLCVCFTCFSSCKKGPKLWDVSYEVEPNVSANVEYIVKYTLANGATFVSEKQRAKFVSPTVSDFKEGETAVLEIEVMSGSANFELRILRQGVRHRFGNAPNGKQSHRITAVI